MAQRTLKEKRIADMMVVRELWHQSLREQPALALLRRIDAVTREANRKAPSGAFYHLCSFKTSGPTVRWVRLALKGRTDNGANRQDFADSLLPLERRIATRVANADRLANIEARLKALEDGLGISHATSKAGEHAG